jgi:ABC-type nitrate/sulfonate/bicarbonate transport system substrate-binding protein
MYRTMEKNRLIGLIIIVLVLIGAGAWYLLPVQLPTSTPLTDITIVTGQNAASTLLIVAKDKGYFTQHGLNVTFSKTPSASAALQNLVDRQNDFVFVNEYDISDPALYNKNVRVIGTLSESDVNFIVARRDRGIVQVQDLEGKKIGVTKGSIREYFLDRFFVLNGLSLNNNTIINLQLAPLANATVDGDIDASFSSEPYVYQMRRQMGENAVVWPVNLGQHAHFSLVCNENTLQEHPEIVEAVLASALQAETYVNSHPEEAKKVAQEQTKFDDQYMDQDWQNHQFSVTLSQSLITSMKDETRWRIRKNLTDVKDVPDFSKYVSWDILYRLKPSAVTIIR